METVVNRGVRPTFVRNVAMLEAMLEGVSIKELTLKYNISATSVTNSVKKICRNMYSYYRDMYRMVNIPFTEADKARAELLAGKYYNRQLIMANRELWQDCLEEFKDTNEYKKLVEVCQQVNAGTYQWGKPKPPDPEFALYDRRYHTHFKVYKNQVTIKIGKHIDTREITDFERSLITQLKKERHEHAKPTK